MILRQMLGLLQILLTHKTKSLKDLHPLVVNPFFSKLAKIWERNNTAINEILEIL